MGFSLKKVFKSSGAVGSILGAGIGAMTGNPAIGAEIGGSIGSMFGPSEERLQRRQEVQSMRDAISFWNMQNEYNSPLAQRQRLEAAGLNPYALNGSIPDNTAGSLSVPSVSYRSKRKGNWSAVEKFFLNKSMENAEDQNMRNELINENWRLRNLKLAKQIEDSGHVALSDKVRSSDPFIVDMNTTVDDIMSNPNLTTKEKREYVALVKKLHPNKQYGSIFSISTWANMLKDGLDFTYNNTDWSKQNARESLRRFRAEAMRK